MKAYRAAVLAEVATNEAALPPEQVAILQRCVGASTHKSMTALQQASDAGRFVSTGSAPTHAQDAAEACG